MGISVQNPSDADHFARDPADPQRIEFSFIVPTLNEEKLIESTLASLQKCQRFSHEIIVSDGNSTDRTVELATPYADRIVMAKRSASSGRNTGARIARGQYLIFVDADTAIPSIDDFMTIAVRRFRENPKLVGLTVKVKATPPDDRSVAMRIFYGASNITCWLFNNLLRKGCAPGIFQMINADVFRATGGYNEDLAAGQDVELFARVAKFGRTAYETSIHVFTSPRRPARLGVARLLTVQLINGISVLIFRKSLYKEWKSVR